MQVARCSHSLPPLLLCLGFFSTLAPPAFAAADLTPDVQMLAELETRARQSDPRDHVFLYTDLADKLSVLASRQIQSGQETEAAATLARLEACSLAIETELSPKSKGLKKAELLMHTTGRRLGDLVRISSTDLKPKLQSALARLHTTQSSVLAKMFDH